MLTPERIELERLERMGLWRGLFAEPLEVVPIEIADAVPGSVCRLWFMPNQSRFVVAGETQGSVKIIHECGSVAGFNRDALVVVVQEPEKPLALLERIQDFESQMRLQAWTV